MKKTLCNLNPVVALLAGAMGFAQEPIKPAEMTEKALLAKARQLAQEEFELSKIAMKQARSAKVRGFAEQAGKRCEALDNHLGPQPPIAHAAATPASARR